MMMLAYSSIHSSSSLPESQKIPYVYSTGESSVSLRLTNNRLKGAKIPRQGFLKLAKHRHFESMMEILGKPDEYDLDAWLFPSADNVPVLSPGISSSPIECLSKSLNLSSDSSTTSSSHKRHSFRSLPSLSPSGNKSGRNDEYNLHLFRGETPLHVLLRYNPTEELVNNLIDYLSQSEKSLGVPEDSVDMLGRTPLHVACANGCSAAVVERLINGVSAAVPAFAKDSMGRHALHWACANPVGDCCLEHKRRLLLRKNNKFVETMSMVNNMVKVVKVLLKAYPEAVFIADHDGNRPKDLAGLHNADERIILLLSREEQYCELENDYHKQFASVACTSVGLDNTLALPAMLRDDVSSICSNGTCEPEMEKISYELEQSPFQSMKTSREVIHFVEKSMLRPPLVLDDFDIISKCFDNTNFEGSR